MMDYIRERIATTKDKRELLNDDRFNQASPEAKFRFACEKYFANNPAKYRETMEVVKNGKF